MRAKVHLYVPLYPAFCARTGRKGVFIYLFCVQEALLPNDPMFILYNAVVVEHTFSAPKNFEQSALPAVVFLMPVQVLDMCYARGVDRIPQHKQFFLLAFL